MSSDTFVPLYDNCQVCGRTINWLFGGEAWIHIRADQELNHEAVPTKRIDLKTFKGCTPAPGHTTPR